MATPYSTPRYPGAPNPTPRSTGKLPRAPIHNPYDKFTQPEFDAWIGDITGALKRALGREDPPPLSAPARRELTSADEDEGPEDSFAEVRARRLAKGKERAREEDFEDEPDASEQADESVWGMPFDEGEDYGSSSEEEDEDEDAEEQRRTEVIDLLSDEEEDAEEEDAEEEDVALSEEDEAVAGPALVSDDEDEVAGEESSDSSDEDVESAPVEEDEDVANTVGHSDEGEDEEEDEEEEEERRSSPAPAKPNHYEVTEILDSDEEPEEQEINSDHHTVPARFSRKPDFANNVATKSRETVEDDAADEDVDENEVEDNEEDNAEPFPPQADEENIVDIPDPWQGPRELAEDYYSGGDVPSTILERGNPHVLPTEADIDELVDDTPTQPLEIPDPWEGPRTFAEDYYAGGDLPQSLDDLTPSHLTPSDEGELFIPGISAAAEKTSLATFDSRHGADEDVGINDLYADIDQDPSAQRLTHSDGKDIDEGGVAAEDARLPSPSPTNLTTHVDWNYPPAFPGRIATGPGHIADEDHEIIAISDDEDDTFFNEGVPPHSTGLGTAQERTAGDSSDLASMSLYTDLDLYDIARLDEEAYEPVSPNGFDFGDLPPSRGESHVDTQVLASDKPPAFVESAVAEDVASVTDQEPTVVGTSKASGLVPEEDVNPSTLEETVNVAAIIGDIDQSSAMDYLIDDVAIEERVAKESPSFEREGEFITHTKVNGLHIQVDAEEDLSGEYPAPVSADPTVPDPASVVQTPASPVSRARSPTDSIASSSGDVQEAKPLPGHAALLPLVNQIAAARSPSGLFTPLTVLDSGSATPERQQDYVDGEVTSNVEAVQSQSSEPVIVNEAPVEDVAPVDDAAGEHIGDLILPESVGEEAATPLGPSPSHQELSFANDPLADAPEDDSVLHSQRTGSPDEREESPATDIDADAEGEIDPDYVPSEEDPVEGSSVAPPDVIGQEGSVPPDTTGAAQSTVTEDAVIASPSVNQEDDPFTNGYVDRSALVEAEHDSQPPAEMPMAAGEEPSNGTAEDAVGPTEESDTHTDVAPSQETVIDESRDDVRPLKRKRKSPPVVERPIRQLRSRSTKSIDQGRPTELPVKSKRTNGKGKGKGKQRAREESDGEDGVSAAPSVASEATSGSSSAAAQQLLIPGSRATSRESSVVSNAPSTYSALSQPSPTIMRTLISNGHNLPPPPFLHDNGVLRHHHGARPVLPAIVPPIRRQPSKSAKPSPTASEPSRRSSAELESPQSPRTSQLARPSPPLLRPSPKPSASLPSIAASSSSPVTRANCRYHTISLPQDEDEDGPRLFFAVPGCSLGNGELMKEESIEDHGDVHGEDIPRLVTNVEDLDLSPYLVGVLRQLVGVDLLREQEVLYLPRPGDTVTVKRNRRRSQRAPLTLVDSISPAQRESISARTLSNGGLTRKSRLKKTTSMPPPSQASVSTSGGSARHAGKRSDRGSVAGSSFSGSDLSDLDDDEDMPPPKRAKDNHPEPVPEVAREPAQIAGSSQEAPAENGDKNGSISVARRSKRRKLGSDALAYKPESDGESDGEDEEEGEDAQKKRKRGGRKSTIKRTRTEEVVDAPAEGSVEKPKRRRGRVVDKVEAGENP